MPCCVSGCSNLSSELTTKFPRDLTLLERWKDAIKAGTGQELPTDMDTSTSSVCGIHFQHSSTGKIKYQEPTLFFRDNVLFRVACCRLCMRFGTIDTMFDKANCVIQQFPLQSLAYKHFGMFKFSKEQEEEGFFCETCVVRIDVTHAWYMDMNTSEKDYKHIMLKVAKLNMVFENTLQVLNADDQQLQETAESKALEGIIIKEETQLMEPDTITDWKMKEAPLAEQEVPAPLGENQSNKTTCYICNLGLVSEKLLVDHLMLAHGKQSLYDCDICKDSFENIRSLNDHLLTHKMHDEMSQGEEETEIILDSETHDSGKAAFETANNYPQETSYKCEFCSIRYDNGQELVDHYKEKHPQMKVGRILSPKLSLLPKGVPLVVYVGNLKRRVVKCNVCKATYKTSKEMVAHFQEAHKSVELKTYKCKHEDCGEVFFKKHTMYTHKYIHTDKHACDICGKRHYSRRSLKIHSSTLHGGAIVDDYYATCPICGRKFQRGSNFQTHLRSHQNDRPYSCDTCGSFFKEREHLIRHNRSLKCLNKHMSDSGAEPIFKPKKKIKLIESFDCDDCGKSFTRRSRLELHQRKHSGLRPISCPGCRSKFGYPSSFYRHKKKCAAYKNDVLDSSKK